MEEQRDDEENPCGAAGRKRVDDGTGYGWNLHPSGGGNLVSTVSAAETVSDFVSLKSALESGETSISVTSAITIPAGEELTIDGDVEIQMVGAEATLLVEGTLTLSDNAVLRGNDDADRKVSVVIVENGGVFTMKGGTITGNTARYVSLNVDRCGGGVTVRDGEIGGKFIMNGGTITGNTAMYGGGVHIATTRKKTQRVFLNLITAKSRLTGLSTAAVCI